MKYLRNILELAIQTNTQTTRTWCGWAAVELLPPPTPGSPPTVRNQVSQQHCQTKAPSGEERRAPRTPSQQRMFFLATHLRIQGDRVGKPAQEVKVLAAKLRACLDL